MLGDKVGILTFFHNSRNYGGCLQAYALPRYLQQKGVAAEQINYLPSHDLKKRMARVAHLSPDILAEKAIRYIRRLFLHNTAEDTRITAQLEIRANAFSAFRTSYIPNSDKVYIRENIGQAVPHYNVFIAGSDQVWNEVVEDSPYLLSFVPKGKCKLSYAASIGQDTLSSYARMAFAKALPEFDAISVREDSAVALLSQINGLHVTSVLDPTLLLPAETWNEICDGPVARQPYIFCYFLGSGTQERKLARQFAGEQKLPVAALPHLQGRFCISDKDFADIELWDVSPKQFLSLVRHAEYVFTDSFHACVFSHLYQKQFFAFPRAEGKSNARILDFLKIIRSTHRYIDTASLQSAGELAALAGTDYSLPFDALEERLRISRRFLERVLISKVQHS